MKKTKAKKKPEPEHDYCIFRLAVSACGVDTTIELMASRQELISMGVRALDPSSTEGNLLLVCPKVKRREGKG